MDGQPRTGFGRTEDVALASSRDSGVPHGAIPAQKSAPYGCPELEGTPEQQLESMLCMHHGHPAAMARVGDPAVAAGFQVVSSVHLGFWGGSAAAVLAARSTQAALAFEVVWSGLTGHLTGWMAGQQRPSAGQTLADSGATLADRLLRTGGSLDTLWTMILFGRTYDALVREAAATHGGDAGTDAGVDVGPDVPTDTDSGTDTDEDTGQPGGTRYEGETTLYGDEMEFDEDCIGTSSVELEVVVTDFEGDGTPIRPYSGAVEVSGRLIVLAAGDCGGTLPLGDVTGRIGGVQNAVGFDLESPTPPRYKVTFSNGVVEGPTRTLTGDISVGFWPEGVFWFAIDGIIELSEVD